MKKLRILTLLSLFIVIINSCKKEKTDDEDKIEINSDGLVVGIPPIQQDTIIVNSNMNVISNQQVNPADLSQDYQLQLYNFPTSKIKVGTVIVDNSDKGRIWVITQVQSNNSSNKSTSSFSSVIAKLGTLAALFRNVVIEVSTPGNRAKTASNNPNKLQNGKFRFLTANNTNLETNINTINIPNFSFDNGINFSVNANTVTLNFNNYEIFSNQNHTLNIKVPNGTVKINNALDLKMKYNPAQGVFNGITMKVGALKDLKSSIYTDLDADLNINFQTTTNGNINIIDEEKLLGHYNKLIPLGHLVLSIDVKIKAKFNINTNAQFNITPHIITKNNFETRIDYDGEHITNSNLTIHHQNLENTLQTSVTGEFNLNQRLEIYPEVEVYVYGLIGPSGKIIPYENYKANMQLSNSVVTWDNSLKLGLDYASSLDVSIFHFEDLTNSLISRSGNLYETTIYKAPETATIISGNNQSGTGGTTLADPIKVKVTDNLNNPLSNVPVFFEVTGNTGSFNQDFVYTDSNGFAEATWTLDNTTGTQTARVFLKDGQGNEITNSIQTLTATANGTSSIPTVGTASVVVVSSTSATSGGNIINDGGSQIISKGVCWSTSINPTISDPHTDDGSGTVAFGSTITGLQPNTTYYVRAYATNSAGTGYGNEEVFTTFASGSTTFPGQTVLVNGGTFLMGNPVGTGGNDEHPQHNITVSSFHISKYEITNQQYADFMNAIGVNADGSVAGVEYLDMASSHCQINYTSGQFVPESGKENYPVIKVSWYGAKAYAEHYGGRLPTEAEWEFAASGGNSSNGYTYSGSNNIEMWLGMMLIRVTQLIS